MPTTALPNFDPAYDRCGVNRVGPVQPVASPDVRSTSDSVRMSAAEWTGAGWRRRQLTIRSPHPGASGDSGVRRAKDSFPEGIAEAMQRAAMTFVSCATMRAREIAISELRRAPW